MSCIIDLKNKHLWPPSIIPDVYLSGFDHWYSENNILRIKSNLDDIVQIAGNQKSLDVNFGNPILLNIEQDIFDEKYALYIYLKKNSLYKELNNTIITEGDCYCMPYKEMEFNIVSSYAFLHLIPDHINYFKEVYRVLKSGGCFYSDGDKNILVSKLIRLFKLGYYRIKGNRIEYLNWLDILRPKPNFHTEGINFKLIKKQLLKIGFTKVTIKPWITMKPEYFKKPFIRFIISLMKIFRLNFLFTHIQIIAIK